MQFPLKIEREQWVYYLSVSRLALAGSCLLAQLVLVHHRNPVVTLALVLFVALSALVVKRREDIHRRFGKFALFLDTLFFMLLARYGEIETLWLAPAFYLYLLTAAVSLFGPREVAVVAAACVLFFATAHPGAQFVLRETILVGGAFACAYSLQKRRLERQLQDMQAQVEQARDLAKTAREAECQRIAADFHDGPLQSVISFQMRLEILRKLLNRDLNSGKQELEQLIEMAKGQVREMRSFVREMRPLDVDGASLTAATRKVVDEFQKESGIPVTFVGGDRVFSAAPETCTDLLQMVREALSNVQKHSKATRVAVALERVGQVLEVSVDDNGVGFPFSGTFSLDELELLRLGPVSLKRRARSLGADLQLESRPGRGAGLKLKVPI